jgi:hypothetical protein
MSERMVNICVNTELRNMIKQKKGSQTYNQFFKNLLNFEKL